MKMHIYLVNQKTSMVLWILLQDKDYVSNYFEPQDLLKDAQWNPGYRKKNMTENN